VPRLHPDPLHGGAYSSLADLLAALGRRKGGVGAKNGRGGEWKGRG